MLLAIARLAFVSLGLHDGASLAVHPALPRSAAKPAQPPAGLGHGVAYLASSFSRGALVVRLGVGRLLLWTSILMVVNSCAYKLAPAWGVMVAAGPLASPGAGAIDAGINACPARPGPS